jgi:hypothetical protein
MAKKNCKQDSSAIKEAIKQGGKKAMAAGAERGAVVSLKVDYCIHSRAQCLIDIVYEMKESIGGIMDCCEQGVIAHDRR